MPDQNSSDDFNIRIRWWYLPRKRRLISAVTTLRIELSSPIKPNDVALISGLLKFQEIKATQGIALIAAFAAGGAERLVIRAVETVAPQSKS